MTLLLTLVGMYLAAVAVMFVGSSVNCRLRFGHWDSHAHEAGDCGCFSDEERRVLKAARARTAAVRRGEWRPTLAAATALPAAPSSAGERPAAPVGAPIFLDNFKPRPVQALGAPPFGYRREGSSLVPTPYEQAVINEIRELAEHSETREAAFDPTGRMGRYGPLDVRMVADIIYFGHCVEAPYGHRRSLSGELEPDPLEQEVLVVIRELVEAGAAHADDVIGALLYEGYLYRGSPKWPVRLAWLLMD